MQQLLQGLASVQQVQPPPVPPQAAAAVAPVTVVQVVAPRVGGIDIIEGKQYAWTGGGTIQGTTLRTRPGSAKAYRPTDFKSLNKMETQCQEGLVEAHRLPTPDKIATDVTAVTLQTWIDRVKVALQERGLDTVFRMVISPTEEHYLLEEFGRAEVGTVTRWVNQVRALGCIYDEANLVMSGKMLLASLSLDMLKKAERELPSGASGPEVYAVIINLHQSLNTSAVRVLTEQLQKLRLTKEAAENVESFSEKVIEVAKRIEGAGPTTCPKDLPTLIFECYQGCSTASFALEVTLLYLKASKGDPSVDDWEAAVSELKASYRALITRKGWEAEKHHKEKAEAQAMHARVTKLEKASTDGTKTPASPAAGGADTRACYHCGKKGHIKPNCPDKDKPKVAGTGAGSASGTATAGSETSNGLDRKKAPADGEPHTKNDSEGLMHKWCGTCKRWNSGEKAHLTEEHVKGKGKVATAPNAAGALAVAEEDTNDIGGTLRLVSGYMAKMGRTRKHSAFTYCEVCDQVAHCDPCHSDTYNHKQATLQAILGEALCDCVRSAKEDGWVVVKNKSGPLKDQAGRS
jgi:hypothetical protein